MNIVDMQLVWCRIISSIFIFDYNSNKLWIKNEQESNGLVELGFFDGVRIHVIPVGSPGSHQDLSQRLQSGVRLLEVSALAGQSRDVEFRLLVELYHASLCCTILPFGVCSSKKTFKMEKMGIPYSTFWKKAWSASVRKMLSQRGTDMGAWNMNIWIMMYIITLF